jgi:hypothetical protein
MSAEKPANAVVISTASASTALFDRTGQTGPENHNAVKNDRTRCTSTFTSHLYLCVNSLHNSVRLLCTASGQMRFTSCNIISIAVPKSMFIFPLQQCNKTNNAQISCAVCASQFFSWTLQCNRHQMETTFCCGSNITLDEEQSISLADIDSRLGGTQWETKVPMFACNAFLIERVKCALVFGHLPSKVYSDCLFSVLQPVQHL